MSSDGNNICYGVCKANGKSINDLSLMTSIISHFDNVQFANNSATATRPSAK